LRILEFVPGTALERLTPERPLQTSEIARAAKTRDRESIRTFTTQQA